MLERAEADRPREPERPEDEGPSGALRSERVSPGPTEPGLGSPASGGVFVAGLWRRLAATLLDTVLLAPVLLLVGWMAFRVTGVTLPSLADVRFEAILELFLEGGSLLYSLLGMGLLLLLLYGFFFTATVGATPGLKLLGLRVINAYGESPEWWRAVLRGVGLVTSGLLLGLGFLWIGFDRSKRGLHDWMAGTYVIRRRA